MYSCAPATTLVISVESATGGMPENSWQSNVQKYLKGIKLDTRNLGFYIFKILGFIIKYCGENI